MEIQPLKIGTKMAKVPVIQGGMGVGISLGNLAGAVAKEGGIGIISAAQPGFKEKDFEKNPLEANLRAVKSEYEKARKLAPDGIIGFNLMVAMEHYEEYVHAVVEAGADLIVSGAGLPTELPKYVGDSDILLAPIVSTAKSANVILKYWDKKYQRIPDLVVIEGPLAGGHLGFREDQLDEYEGQAIYEEGRSIIVSKPVAITSDLGDNPPSPEVLKFGNETKSYFTESAPKVLGDANGDKTTDIRDLVRLKTILAGLSEETENADVDNNGVIDSFDLAALRKILLGILG